MVGDVSTLALAQVAPPGVTTCGVRLGAGYERRRGRAACAHSSDFARVASVQVCTVEHRLAQAVESEVFSPSAAYCWMIGDVPRLRWPK